MWLYVDGSTGLGDEGWPGLKVTDIKKNKGPPRIVQIGQLNRWQVCEFGRKGRAQIGLAQEHSSVWAPSPPRDIVWKQENREGYCVSLALCTAALSGYC